MVFERDVEWFGKGHIQTLEPRLYYVNIPYRDQSNIPLFDTALADFNFAQIFSENRYSGYDRINDANQLTLALTTRLLSSESGAEQFKAMIGQRYYFKPQRVAITGETTRQDDFSNLVAAVNGLVAPKTYMDVAWEYNYSERTSDRFSAGVRFQPDLGKVLSASYRHTRDPLKMTSTVDQIDIAGQWPLSAQWYGIGRYNYSLRDSRVLETIAGVEYNAGCWAVRVVGQRLAAISGSPNDTLFFQLELNDFGSIGTNPIGLLRRSIPGYGKINELPTDGNLLTTQ
jgi:LPS-assembly protein